MTKKTEQQKAGGTPTPPTHLVIDRSRWLRAEGPGPSLLLRSRDGKMCCLGFFGEACGVTEDELVDHATPFATGSRRWPGWLLPGGNQTLSQPRATAALMTENDGLARESEIARIFAEHGVTVEFVDGTVCPTSTEAGQKKPPEQQP